MNFKKIILCLFLICIFACTVNMAFADSFSANDIEAIGNKTFGTLTNFTLEDNPTEEEWYETNEFDGELRTDGFSDGMGGLIPYSPYIIGIQKKNVTKEQAQKYLSKYLPSDYEVTHVKFNGKLSNIYYYQTDVFSHIYNEDIYGEPQGDYYYKGYIFDDDNIYWYIGNESVINPWLSV